MSLQERKTVLLYQVYIVFSEPLFWGPIVTYSLANLAHMTLPAIFVMEAVVVLFLVVVNVPAGAVADVIGKKQAVLIGRIFHLVSTVCFAFMTSPLHAWIGNLAWAVGYALTSGSESSLLYEALNRAGTPERFRQVQGSAISRRYLVIAFTCLAVGALSAVDPRLPLYLAIPGQVLTIFLVAKMQEPATGRRLSLQAQVAMLRQGVQFVLTTPIVMWMMAFAALIGVVSKVWFFTYNPYFELVQVPLTQYGTIFFLLNMVAWLSGRYVHVVEARVRELQLIVFAILCIALPILTMAIYPLYAMAYLVLAQNIVRGFLRPFTEDFLHHHISLQEEVVARSTIVSIQSAVTQLVAVLGLAIAGVALDYLHLTTVLWLLGLVTLVLGALVVGWYLYLTKSTAME